MSETIGYLTGVCLVNIVIIFALVLVFNRFNVRKAWEKMLSFKVLLGIILLAVLPQLIKVGSSLS